MLEYSLIFYLRTRILSSSALNILQEHPKKGTKDYNNCKITIYIIKSLIPLYPLR